MNIAKFPDHGVVYVTRLTKNGKKYQDICLHSSREQAERVVEKYKKNFPEMPGFELTVVKQNLWTLKNPKKEEENAEKPVELAQNG